MKFLKDIKLISEVLFYLLGGSIFLAFLFWKNDFFVLQTEIFLRYVDLPFAFIALLFLGTSFRIFLANKFREDQREDSEDESEEPVLDAILMVVGSVIFFGLVYIDFAFPNIF